VVSPIPNPQAGGLSFVGSLWLLIQYIHSHAPYLKAAIQGNLFLTQCSHYSSWHTCPSSESVDQLQLCHCLWLDDIMTWQPYWWLLQNASVTHLLSECNQGMYLSFCQCLKWVVDIVCWASFTATLHRSCFPGFLVMLQNTLVRFPLLIHYPYWYMKCCMFAEALPVHAPHVLCQWLFVLHHCRGCQSFLAHHLMALTHHHCHTPSLPSTYNSLVVFYWLLINPSKICQEFKYLETTVINQSCICKEIKSRLN